MDVVIATIAFGQLLALIAIVRLLATVAQNQKTAATQISDDSAATAASLLSADAKRQTVDDQGAQAVRTKQQ